MKVGITGGIGSGKSTVSSIFELLGIPVYYADIEAKKLMVSNLTIREKVIELFGKESYINGELNRKHISAIAFNDSTLLEKLNATVHPVVIGDYKEWVKQQSAVYTLKEAALLFESGTYLDSDFNILVSSPLDLRIERVMKRDHVSREEVLARITKQMPEEEKERLATFIIYNNESEFLITQVLSIHQKVLSLVNDKR
ncbi:dephospho-CoA kinase [Pseudopedobacter saltans DSM 12145]|uniref:Dephospho-CoA kinase n=1 Tax=Pseudopedobacter saltans (strain ATCC 51119 / DSM 12145 / JCM 21818 / CCUG 39354 / LMG 10337 / NBRC 100064 / NCIMB 13643) TaxID=762903 RepID=F0SAL2_PSESL|nr:dephospho-CoA kinase [Pseudopedobacter saltans]ADY52632.1 dephospho-CoA kinase [Pseudopedobacter saltans DSM 12145]